MSQIYELLDAVRAAGASIRAEGDKLKISPPGIVSPELKERLREKKPEIIRYLEELEASMQRLEADKHPAGDELQSRLNYHGVSIAIDRKTGAALLLFKDSDAEIVRDVADVYQAFQVGELAPAQRKELLGSLEYYEGLARKVNRPTAVPESGQQ